MDEIQIDSTSREMSRGTDVVNASVKTRHCRFAICCNWRSLPTDLLVRFFIVDSPKLALHLSEESPVEDKEETAEESWAQFLPTAHGVCFTL